MTMKQVALIPLLLVLSLKVATAAEQPNIVFFFADDQTTSTLGCYGNDVVKTPQHRSLAERRHAVRQHAFVSHSICWVSRTTILTGLTGRELWHTQQTPNITRRTQPFRVVFGYSAQTWVSNRILWQVARQDAQGIQPREDHFRSSFEAIGRNPFLQETCPTAALRHETELIVDRGIEFILKSQPKGQAVCTEHVVQCLPRRRQRPPPRNRAFPLAARR